MSLTSKIRNLHNRSYDGGKLKLPNGTRVQRVGEKYVIDRGRGITITDCAVVKDTPYAAARFALARDRSKVTVQ